MATHDYALLADFGSTFTKLTAVDIGRARVVATSSSPTTLHEGLMVGLERALLSLECPLARRGLSAARDWGVRLACSSAAGGLRMVAIGLVPELTAEAARRAALGAGARVLKAYAYELNRHEVSEIESLAPDILLLAGGTDGGNKAVLLANASALAASSISAPIVVAGNKVVTPQAIEVLLSAGKDAREAENVMPELGRLNVDPVRAAIREIFIERIVAAKGLDAVAAFMDGGPLMPTPAAVLASARLLADGVPGEGGLGEVMVVDPGGATTDVHTVASGRPTMSNVTLRGLPEPRVKRTVEADLGARHSGASLAEAMGLARIADLTGISEGDLEAMVQALPARAGDVPHGPREDALDEALAMGAVAISVARHVGTLDEAYTPFGVTYIQRGKDLTALQYVVGSGGPVIHAAHPRAVLEQALFREDEPQLLRPKLPRFLLDKEYILSAMGLLAQVVPQVAMSLLKDELLEV